MVLTCDTDSAATSCSGSTRNGMNARPAGPSNASAVPNAAAIALQLPRVQKMKPDQKTKRRDQNGAHPGRPHHDLAGRTTVAHRPAHEHEHSAGYCSRPSLMAPILDGKTQFAAERAMALQQNKLVAQKRDCAAHKQQPEVTLPQWVRRSRKSVSERQRLRLP